MAKVINLRMARKARDRAAKRQGADENAARYGRTRTERVAEAMDKARARAHLDGTKREQDD